VVFSQQLRLELAGENTSKGDNAKIQLPYATTPNKLKQKKRYTTVYLFFNLGAQDWIRTSTSLRTLRPEHSASTNFATWALLYSFSGTQK
jgi:hypothetical protein